MTTQLRKPDKGKAVIASVGGGLSIAVGPWQVIAADRRLAADALGGEPPTDLLLIPSPEWVLEDITLKTPRAALEEVVAEIKARGIDIHCDYHHQSLYAAKTGIQAPAAGWAAFSGFRVDARGLWATSIRWTAAADAYLRNGEYRYFSPVVYFEDKTLTVTSLDSWALTNTPRTNDQPPLTAAMAAARFHTRRIAASMEAGMEKWVDILINFLNSLWCYSPDELLAHIDTAREKFVQVMSEAGEPAAVASSEFAKSLPKNATILQALIAGGLKIPDGVVQLAAAKLAAESDDVPANLLQIVSLPAETKRTAFAAHLVSLVTERVPRSEVATLEEQLAAARETGEKAKIDAMFRKFADRYNAAEEPELRSIASSSPENLAAVETNLSQRQPIVQKPASKDTAPKEPKLASATTQKRAVAGEQRVVSASSVDIESEVRAILAEKGWGMDKYAEANAIRKERSSTADAVATA